MGLRYDVFYYPIVLKEDIPKLSSAQRIRIKSAIEEKLTMSPDIYGKPLRRSLKGFRTMRVGDYRVVFKIDASIVYVIAILHRSLVYKLMEKR